MAKRKTPSFLTTQKEKLEAQLRDKKEKRNSENVAQYEKEKKRNAERQSGNLSRYRMTGSRGHGSEYEVNPRISYRHNEEVLVDYLLDEGFASDEKSAFAIMSVMSEDWKQSIVEVKGVN